MSQGTAVLRFGSPEAASRARKRMENEDVCGHRISLSFSPRPRDDASPEHMLQSQPLHLPLPLPQTYQNQDSVFAPPPSISSFSFLPLEKPRSPRRPRRATRPCHTVGPVPERPYSPRRGCSGPPGGVPAKPHQVSRLVSAMQCLLPLRRPLFFVWAVSLFHPHSFLLLTGLTACSCSLTLYLSACANM